MNQRDTKQSEPSRSIHEWYDYIIRQKSKEQWNRATWRTKLWWFRQSAYRLVTVQRLRKVTKEALNNIQQYGAITREEYGVSLVRQLLQQCYIALNHNTPPASYYTYRLYLDERWEISDQLLYDWWSYHGKTLWELIHRSSQEERPFLRCKEKFYLRCRHHNIPTPSILAVFENGAVRFNQRLSESLPKKDLFAKPSDGGHGNGTIKYSYDSYRDVYFDSIDSSYVDSDDLINSLKSKSSRSGKIIVQPCFQNHDSWTRFTPGALATARLITGKLPDKQVVVLGGKLKMPTGGAIVDNSSAGGIFSQIDLETGRLGIAIPYVPEKTFNYHNHPDTGFAIEGARLPFWDEICELCIESHSTFAMPFIGWDVSATTEGLMIIEANDHWGVDPLEIPELRREKYDYLFDKWASEYID